MEYRFWRNGGHYGVLLYCVTNKNIWVVVHVNKNMSLSLITDPSAELNPANTFYVYSLTAGTLSFVSASISGNLAVGGNITSLGGPVNIVAPVNQNINLSTSGTGGVEVFGNNFNVTTIDAGLHLTGNLFLSAPLVAPNTALVVNAGSMVSGLALTNGQLVIGSTGALPAAANLTAGSNVVITNGPGSISLAVSSTPLFSSITLPSSQPLSSYQVATISPFLWSGPFAAPANSPLSYVVVGNVVTLSIRSIGALTLTGTSAITSQALPAGLAPSSTRSNPCWVYTGSGVYTNGLISVGTNGVVTFFAIVPGTTGSASPAPISGSAGGFDNTNITYCL
jgi:hypothetical protein